MMTEHDDTGDAKDESQPPEPQATKTAGRKTDNLRQHMLGKYEKASRKTGFCIPFKRPCTNTWQHSVDIAHPA